MWVFTKRAFMSAVVYDPTKDREKNSPFRAIAKKPGTHILVRARVKADLDDLKAVVPNVVIDDQAAADYRFRAVIPRKAWKKYLANSVDEMDYDSHFKEVVEANATQGRERHAAMMQVWSDMLALQPYDRKPFVGSKTYKGVGQSSYVSPYGAASAYTYTYPAVIEMDMGPAELKALILKHLGVIELFDEEKDRLTDEAYEVYTRLLDSGGDHASEGEIDAMIEDVHAYWDDTEEKA